MNLTTFLGQQRTAAGVAIDALPAVLPNAPTPVPPGPTEDAVTYPTGVPTAPSATYDTPPGEGVATDTLPITPSTPLPLQFSFPPSRVFSSELQYDSLQMSAARGRRGYRLQWNAISTADKNTLTAFLFSHKTTPFYWTAEGDSQRSWKLREPRYTCTTPAPGVWFVEAVVVEILA